MSICDKFDTRPRNISWVDIHVEFLKSVRSLRMARLQTGVLRPRDAAGAVVECCTGDYLPTVGKFATGS